jgi:transposase
MPKHLSARPPLDATEERKVRKLTRSTHAPADWIFHAQIVAHSWDGLRTRQIAEALGCHPQTVRERLQAFNDRGFEGLGMKPGGGRKPRLTEQERSTILSLIHFPPPGQPTYELTGELTVPDPKGELEWTLDALTAMARTNGIQVARDPAARCGASSARKGCAGGTPGSGRAARILTSSQKGSHRRALYRPACRSHRSLCRLAETNSAP